MKNEIDKAIKNITKVSTFNDAITHHFQTGLIGYSTCLVLHELTFNERFDILKIGMLTMCLLMKSSRDMHTFKEKGYY